MPVVGEACVGVRVPCSQEWCWEGGSPVPGEQEPLGFSGPVAGAASLAVCQGMQQSLPSGSSHQLQRELKSAVCLGFFFLPG